MQTHNADKKHECNRCGKLFALKSYLNKHLEASCTSPADKSNQDPKTQDQAYATFGSENKDEDLIRAGFYQESSSYAKGEFREQLVTC